MKRKLAALFFFHWFYWLNARHTSPDISFW